MDALSSALEWYAKLAAVPAFKAHTWHQVNEFAREHPGVFGDLPRLLTARMGGTSKDAA